MRNKKHILWGSFAFILLNTFYFMILLIFTGLRATIMEFSRIWYWLISLSFGFGVQVSLFSYVKSKLKEKANSLKKEVAVTGGISTTSMIACCAHHIAEILPLVGFSAMSIFLVKYQLIFILVGIFSNLLGIISILNFIKKHRLFEEETILNKITLLPLNKIFIFVLLVGLISSTTIFATTYLNNKASSNRTEIKLSKKKSNKANVYVTVNPKPYKVSEYLEFEISLGTHSVELDYILEEIAYLEDNNGNIYKPLLWNGDAPGGHHIFGILKFPSIDKKTTKIKLVLKNISNFDRNFEWKLN